MWHSESLRSRILWHTGRFLSLACFACIFIFSEFFVSGFRKTAMFLWICWHFWQQSAVSSTCTSRRECWKKAWMRVVLVANDTLRPKLHAQKDRTKAQAYERACKQIHTTITHAHTHMYTYTGTKSQYRNNSQSKRDKSWSVLNQILMQWVKSLFRSVWHSIRWSLEKWCASQPWCKNLKTSGDRKAKLQIISLCHNSPQFMMNWSELWRKCKA